MFYNWDKYLESNFDKFKNSVIEIMINLYGVEYKDTIIKKLDRVNFIFYGNTLLCIPLKKQNKYEKQNIIYTTKPFKYPYITKGIIKELVNRTSISHTTIYNYNDEDLYYFILFPLYSSDKQLIHEMIHAVTTDSIGITNNGKYISKVGLEITNSSNGETLLEESITELEAKMIYNRLKEKNITFIRDLDLTKYEHECYYEHFIPLVTDFYNKYSKYITYSRITLNKNHLFNVINVKDYEELINNIDFYEKKLKKIYEAKNNYKVKKLT